MGNYRDTSVAVAACRRLRGALSSGESRTGHALGSLTAAFGTAVAASALTGFARQVARWTRESFLYRWLTAEPDPDVVAIDLRETYTVGPIIAVLDRIVTALAGTGQAASVGSLARATRDHLRAQPVRVLSAVALVALVTEATLAVALGTLGGTGVAVRLPVIVVAAVGTQVRVSWAQCRESATYRALVAVLEPPEPPQRDDSERESD